MSKYQQNSEPAKKITEYERGILYAFYGPVPATSNDEAVLLKVKNAVEAAEPELKRLRAENEKLRAALKPAYFEGWYRGNNLRSPVHNAERDWEESAAAAALNDTKSDKS